MFHIAKIPTKRSLEDEEYSEIIIQAGLCSDVSENKFVEKIMGLFANNNCNMHYCDETYSALRRCYRLFQHILGKIHIDGEIAARFFHQLEFFLDYLSQHKNVTERIDWENFKLKQNENKKFNANELEKNIKSRFFDLVGGECLNINKNTIYYLLLPAIALSCKYEIEEYDYIYFYTVADNGAPSTAELMMLEKIFLGAVTDGLSKKKFYADREDIFGIYEKYFLHDFLNNLPSLVFYPQPKPGNVLLDKIKCSLGDIENISNDMECIAYHQVLIEAVNKVKELEKNKTNKNEQLIKYEKFLFLSNYRKFSALVEEKIKFVNINKREYQRLFKIHFFVLELEKLLTQYDWCNFESKEAIAIGRLIAPYVEVIDQPLLDDNVMYCQLLAVAKNELMSSSLPVLRTNSQEILTLSAAIIFASLESLKEICQKEENIYHCVGILSAAVLTRFKPVTKELKDIERLLAPYQGIFDKSTHPREIYMQSEKAAKLQILKNPDKDNSLHKAICRLQIDKLKSFKIFTDSVSALQNELKRIVSDNFWNENYRGEDLRSIQGAILLYKAVIDCETLSSSDWFYEFTCIAERCLKGLRSAQQKFFDVPAYSELFRLHYAVINRDIKELNSIYEYALNLFEPDNSDMMQSYFNEDGDFRGLENLW